MQFNHIEFQLNIVRRKFPCFLPFHLCFFFPLFFGGWGGLGRGGGREREGGGLLVLLVRHLKRVSGQSINICGVVFFSKLSVYMIRIAFKFNT